MSAACSSPIMTPEQVQLKRRPGKRAADALAASALLCVLLPLLLLLAALVSATSRGGALYRQRRVGRFGRPFTMYKFRTMRDGCDDAPHRHYVTRLLTDDQPPTGGQSGLYKLANDERITRVGRLLRRGSLDELPQLWNVLIGDMSLVGPRPALPWEAELFSRAHRARFLVPPGLTGLWQVSGRNRLPMRDGLDLDVVYVRQQSALLDLKILLRTVPAVLCVRGVR